MKAAPLHQRFEAKVLRMPFCGCHLWTGAVNAFGYGKCATGNNKWKLAHRIAYEQAKGKIDQSLSVLHLCDTPSCVNPEHLYLGTYKNNAQDRERRGRGNHARGLTHGRVKLTPEDVFAMRSKYKTGEFSFRQLGKIYGVDGKTVNDIVCNKLWQSLQ
jgi:hypothetical protein